MTYDESVIEAIDQLIEGAEDTVERLWRARASLAGEAPAEMKLRRSRRTTARGKKKPTRGKNGRGPGRPRTKPANFVLSEEDGSAYYLYGDELMQVPLTTDDGPEWESAGDGKDFGGGAVDWERGIEDDRTFERLRGIERDLKARS